MGCGSSSAAADSRNPAASSWPRPSGRDDEDDDARCLQAKYAAFEATLRDDPLHRGGFDDEGSDDGDAAPRPHHVPEHDDDEPPPSSGAEGADDVVVTPAMLMAREWAAESFAGPAIDEPSPFALKVRRGAKVAAARLLHGITGDPDQFAEDDAATGDTTLNCVFLVTLRQWLDGCGVGNRDEVSLIAADSVLDVAPAPTTTAAPAAAAVTVTGAIDRTAFEDFIDNAASPSDDGHHPIIIGCEAAPTSGMTSWELPTPPSGLAPLRAPIVARLTTFNLLCHDRYGPNSANHA